MLIKQLRRQAKAPVVPVIAILLGVLASPAKAGERSSDPAPVEAEVAAGHMPLGGPAAAPAGFLDFCRRSPAQCSTPGVEGESLKAIEGRATSLYWAGVFGKAVPATEPAATSRSTSDFRYDWTRVFRGVHEVRSGTVASRVAAMPFSGAAMALSADEFGSSAVDAAASNAAVKATAAVSATDMTEVAAPSPVNPVSRLLAGLSVPTLTTAPAPTDPGQYPGATQRPFQVVVEQPAEMDVRVPAVALDKAGWARVNAINRGVNRRIRRASDIRAFGVADFWQAPTEAGARGDCEDYVLAKREALIDAGVPADALSIAIVMTRWGESHAVLLLASDSGDFVLDNLTPWISRWDAVDYDWQERQAPGKVFDWVRMAS